jgi:3-oxoacyl-[acyl-carrier protein] reductase
MTKNSENKVAVLIGAGRINGVGAATALLLAKEGYDILINCRKNESQAMQIVTQCREYGVRAEIFMADVTLSTACKDMARYVEEKWGQVNVLVNCIGMTKIVPYEDLDQLTEADFAKIFATNVTAPYLVVQAFQKLLSKSANSSVVNISSTAGISGSGSSIAYAASKGALNTLTLALAKALAPAVRVNAVCPGFIDSSWWEENLGNESEKYQSMVKDVKQRNLLNQVIQPIDAANMIVSVIKSPGMTGELIRLDSGAHLAKPSIF